MRLKRVLILGVISLALSGWGPFAALAQQGATQGGSLGDLARQLRSKREKPAKVYTNDNLPARPAPGAMTVAAHMAEESPEGEAPAAEAAATEAPAAEQAEKEAAEKEPAAKEPTEKEVAAPPTSEGESDAHDEKYYRKSIGALRSRLEMHKRQLAVLEQKLAQGQMSFNPDPNKTLQQESTPTFYAELTKLRDDIATKKQEIADDEQAMADLQDQLRREGSPPGWLR